MANHTDTFARANTTSGLGTASDGTPWTPRASHGGVFSNQGYNAAGGNLMVETMDCGAGSADGTVSLKLVAVNSNGVVGRWAAGTGAGTFVCAISVGGQLALYEYTGSFGLLAVESGTLSAGDTIGLTMSGSSLSALKNGSVVCTATSSRNATSTEHGVVSSGNTDLFDDFSFVGGTPDALAQGDPSVTVTSDTTITLLAPAATGGTSPYSYQWKRSTAANGSYSNVGTNSLSLADSSGLSAGTTYWYTVTATDSQGTPATDTSYPVPAKLSGKAYKVRTLGDSHWASGSPSGGQDAPAEFVARFGRILSPRAVTLGGNSNSGGTHSADWIPGASGTPLEAAVTAANTSGDNLYVIGLGSNDRTNGGSPPVSAATYGANMALIVAYIRANATGTPLRIALLAPYYYYDRNGTLAGLDLMVGYAAQLDLLADGVTVFSVGQQVPYQIVTAQSTYLYSDKLHLSYPAGQDLSADLAAMDLAGKLQFASAGGGGLFAARGFTGGYAG